MPIGPRQSDVPSIRRTLAVYKVSSIVTGTFLLGLVVMMVTRYGFGLDIELGGPDGFLALTNREVIELNGSINLSIIILTVHGWLYVLYLGCDFVLWRLLRWSFVTRFLFIALGGVIPFLSFYFEGKVPRWVEGEIAKIAPGPVGAEARTAPTT